MNRMYEKTVVISQASTEIGIAQSILMAREGANIVACGNDRNILVKMFREVNSKGGHLVYYVQDPGKANWNNILTFAKEKFGGVDVLINNPNLQEILRFNKTQVFPASDRSKFIHEEYFQASKSFVLTQKGESEGTIVNISVNFPEWNTSNAKEHNSESKNLYRISSRVLKRYNIRANHIIVDCLNGYQEPDPCKKEISGQSEDLAFLSLFFASDESYTLCGQSIHMKMALL